MWFGYLSVLVLGLLLGGARAAEKPLHILTTFIPGYCFAANVAGDLAQVENLLPGSVSLHDYQLTPGDIRKLAAADVIVANGLGMENFLDKAVANTGPETARKIVRLTDGLASELIPDGAKPNPHVWLDPKLAMRSMSNILNALERRDPPNASAYQKNATAYIARLHALDSEIDKALQSVRDVPFVTYHNAFPYFVRRYQLKLAGIVERMPEIPPSPKELSLLLAKIRDENAKALFTEPATGTRLAQQIAHDAGIKMAELDPLETGKLGPRTYEEVMRRNAQTLRNTLGQ